VLILYGFFIRRFALNLNEQLFSAILGRRIAVFILRFIKNLLRNKALAASSSAKFNISIIARHGFCFFVHIIASSLSRADITL